MAADLAELTISIGLIGSVANSWPEEVQENWNGEVARIRGWADEEIQAVRHFAEAYDGEEEDS